MKMKYRDFFLKIKRNNIIRMKTQYSKYENYLVIKVEKEHVKVLPLSQFEKEDQADVTIPYLCIPYSIILKAKKIDKSKILYYVNAKNPHIIRAIEEM
jgi:hypothetical protein